MCGVQTGVPFSFLKCLKPLAAFHSERLLTLKEIPEVALLVNRSNTIRPSIPNTRAKMLKPKVYTIFIKVAKDKIGLKHKRGDNGKQ